VGGLVFVLYELPLPNPNSGDLTCISTLNSYVFMVEKAKPKGFSGLYTSPF